MLKINSLKNIYSHNVVSNPVKTVKTFFKGLTSHSLESSPKADVLIKSKNPATEILGTDIKSTIKNIVSVDSSAMGKDAKVFTIPNQPDYVLRVEHTALDEIPNLSDDMKLIPIEYNEKVSSHKDLGLPMFFVADKNSALYAKKSVSPLEALNQQNKIMVLRKVQGQNPSKPYFDSLMTLMGIDEKKPSVPQYLNFMQLIDIRKKYGKQNAQEAINLCCGEKEMNIPKRYFARDSLEYSFSHSDEFNQNYKGYVKSYLTSLKDISKLPQKSYNEAVGTILEPKNFRMDFQHTNNTFVDLKNKKFNFMDFEFNPENYPKYTYNNVVEEFRNVLCGKCFCSKMDSPMSLLFDKSDIKKAQKYMDKITKKVNSATPDEYKF